MTVTCDFVMSTFASRLAARVFLHTPSAIRLNPTNRCNGTQKQSIVTELLPEGQAADYFQLLCSQAITNAKTLATPEIPQTCAQASRDTHRQWRESRYRR